MVIERECRVSVEERGGLSCRQLVRRLRRTGSTAGDRAGSTRKARLYSRFM